MDTCARTARLTFRDAEAADVDALVALVESAYRGESSRRGWTTEAGLLDGQRTDREGVLAVVEDERSRLVAVEADGELVGCCQLEHRGAQSYFGMFAVSPERQAEGVGRAVLAEAERRARAEWGAEEMLMTVIEQRADLLAWYERRGYRRTGARSPFPYGDERFGLPRRDDLAFVHLAKPLGRPL
ncbi:GNAT family N-acetyltransferase [Streptomyces sulphureus]|uniref:GNAT family N-acetyltransferase n=1 Tax=Streptomyces sulphureus TaxID=47758 RepID=UPI000380ABBE|nr:GNAT family N-acetyltransferase [Streptomyces sulphureus]